MITKIRTPCLRTLLLVYDKMSVQILPYSLLKWRNAPNFIWNFFLFSVTAYQFLAMNTSYLDEQKAEMTATFSEKPLFAILYHLAMRNDFQLTCLLNAAYFGLLNYHRSELLILLDSFSALKTLQSSAFALFFIACHKVFYFIVLVGMVWNFVASGHWNEATVQYVSLFPMNTTINSGFILIYYCKYATYKSLEEIINRIKTDAVYKDAELTFRTVEREVSRLAKINSRLNSILSFPMFLALLSYTTEMIITMACLIFQKLTVESSYLLHLPLLLVLTSWVETKIEAKLKSVSQYLALRGEAKNSAKNSYFLTVINFSNISLQHEYFYPPRCQLLFELYKKYFIIRVFNLFKINWVFAFNLTLFILNYIILVAQTSV